VVELVRETSGSGLSNRLRSARLIWHTEELELAIHYLQHLDIAGNIIKKT
jgi:hypothetical protein